MSHTVLSSLARSKFRGRFRLKGKDLAYLEDKGLDEVMRHAGKFLATRLFPAQIANDGRQTPMRGHPVFVAQHATATCCRQCLAKWHGIPSGCSLAQAEQERVLAVIRAWLQQEAEAGEAARDEYREGRGEDGGRGSENHEIHERKRGQPGASLASLGV